MPTQTLTAAEALDLVKLIDAADRTPDASLPNIQAAYEKLTAIVLAETCEWCGELGNDEMGSVNQYVAGLFHADCHTTYAARGATGRS